MTFFAPDEERFPAFKLAREAMRRGGALPGVLNAANEAAVELFREGKIGFCRIWELTEAAMTRFDGRDDGTLESRFAADMEARKLVRELARKESF